MAEDVNLASGYDAGKEKQNVLLFTWGNFHDEAYQ